MSPRGSNPLASRTGVATLQPPDAAGLRSLSPWPNPSVPDVQLGAEGSRAISAPVEAPTPRRCRPSQCPQRGQPHHSCPIPSGSAFRARPNCTGPVGRSLTHTVVPSTGMLDQLDLPAGPAARLPGPCARPHQRPPRGPGPPGSTTPGAGSRRVVARAPGLQAIVAFVGVCLLIGVLLSVS